MLGEASRRETPEPVVTAEPARTPGEAATVAWAVRRVRDGVATPVPRRMGSRAFMPTPWSSNADVCASGFIHRPSPGSLCFYQDGNYTCTF
jgi:hypothetical protein